MDDVELSVRCDTEKDLIHKRQEIELKHQWDYLGASVEIVSEALKNINSDDNLAAFNAWETYLNKKLKFPFDAEISEYQNKGPLKQGDKIRIHGILEIDESYGLIVRLRLGKKGYHFPLCDIEVIDKTSSDNQFVDAYGNWYANR